MLRQQKNNKIELKIQGNFIEQKMSVGHQIVSDQGRHYSFFIILFH